MVAVHYGRGGFLGKVVAYATFDNSKLLTVSCLLETVVGIVVGRVYVDGVTTVLQSQRGVDHETFGTA